MNKKGAEDTAFTMIIYIILGAIFLFFSGFFLSKVFLTSDEIAEDTLCYQKGLSFLETQHVDYECPTKYITMFENRLEKEYDHYTPDDNPIVQKFGEDCSDETGIKYRRCIGRHANRAIAKELVTCWDKFHQGQKSLFAQYSEDRQCMICSVFYFDKDIKEKIGGDYMGWDPKDSTDPELSLDHFMRTESPIQGYKSAKNTVQKDGKPVENENKGTTTYYEYTLDLVDKYAESPYYDYDVQYEYAIVLTALNKNRITSISDRLLNFAFGTQDPRGEFINTMDFIENDQVTTICDIIR
ncbi:hypothetical protein HN827_04765 [archaeon]|jgi:hypothetical protein|nr:hypothetical protein [archaeon]MBT4646934.1 hypothetical protein [archaeon]MBT6820798.1 hypothetical protein [archaeon]MBT7392117.1 hypothetical protein [archaeon]